MIDYRKLGFVSEKQHTVCEFEGKMLAEHLITRDGFNEQYSILYQKRAPTHEVKTETYKHDNPFFPACHKATQSDLKRRHFQAPLYKKEGTLLESRATLLVNDNCTVGVAKPTKNMDYFFSNADADELYFVAAGEGILQTILGEIDYTEGDYLFIPKSIPYRIVPKSVSGRSSEMLIVEGKHKFGVPAEFRSAQGQIKLDAPYNHRDFRSPSRLLKLAENENPPVIVKKGNDLTLHQYTDFPYQVVGWDGWYWPFAFAISAYQPKTGAVHLPPTVHMVFSAQQFCIMNFVPRVVDYHPKAVPCPYPHSSVDCDEVIFYVRGDFTSRKGIAESSISFHPAGIPHGPHPECYERSVGAHRTEELGIMIDTFEPLYATEAALSIEDKNYHTSWNANDCL